MLQALVLVLSVLGALGGAKLVRGYVDEANRRRNRPRAFLGASTASYVAIASTPDGKNPRGPDVEGLAALREMLRAKNLPTTCQISAVVSPAVLRTAPLLIFGSPRLNSVADDLQRRIELPFEFVSLTPELPPAPSVLCIYRSPGQEYVCSSDPCLGEVERTQRPRSLNGHEVDYGLLVVGELTDRDTVGQRFIWVAGIHGIGTLGVVKWVLENIDSHDWARIGNVCFLIQTDFHVPKGEAFASGGPHETIKNTTPTLIAGPCPWHPRPQPSSARSIGIMCDMGSVLLPFHRRRFEHNLRHLLGIKALSDAQRNKIAQLQTEFEAGRSDIGVFLTEMRQCLSRDEADIEAIATAWNDIFWRNEREVWLLRQTQNRKAAKLVLISNTDPLRLDHALTRMDLGTIFDRQHVVASFDPGVNPKGSDNSMMSKALAILEHDSRSGPVTPIFIDDVREYLVHAQESGLGVTLLHYRTYAQLVYELRRHGIYEPISGGVS